MNFIKLLITALVLFPLAAAAHDAEPLNPDGCHEDKRYNKYHCHAGVLEGRTFDTAEQAAKAVIAEAVRPKNQSSAGQPVDPDTDPS